MITKIGQEKIKKTLLFLFLLRNSDGRARIWPKQHESMASPNFVLMAQVGVMV